MNYKAYRVQNKRTSMVKESIHVLFDESENGILSEGFNELNLKKHFDDVSDDELDANDQNDDEKKNMQEPIQSLKEVAEKQVEHIECTDFDTPTKDSSKEVETSSLNDCTPSILRRRFRLSSQHPLENIISDQNKGTQIQSSLEKLCAFCNNPTYR